MRSMRKLTLLVCLVVLLPALGRTQPIAPSGSGPDLDDPVLQACIVEAASPGQLQCPDHCGWGIWQPAAVYQDMLRWNLVGKACEKKTENAVIRAAAAANHLIVAAERRSYLFQVEAKNLRDAKDPPILRRVLNVSLMTLTGGGAGAGGGALLAAFTDASWSEGIGGGAVIGAVAGLVSGVMGELLR